MLPKRSSKSGDTINQGTYAEFKAPIVLVIGDYSAEAERITPQAAIIDRGTPIFYEIKDQVTMGINVITEEISVDQEVNIGPY